MRIATSSWRFHVKQIKLRLPFSALDYSNLSFGDKVLLSGEIFTARDQAHQRLIELIHRGEELPFDLSQTALFYCGPSPAAPDQICGAVGPTTSYRMDRYVPALLHTGLRVMIGKGNRSLETEALIREYQALYLIAIGGVSAVLSKNIVSCETYLWQDLGAEAVYRLYFNDFPCYVGVV